MRRFEFERDVVATILQQEEGQHVVLVDWPGEVYGDTGLPELDGWQGEPWEARFEGFASYEQAEQFVRFGDFYDVEEFNRLFGATVIFCSS